MKLKFYLLKLCIIMLPTYYANAQVTIGSNEPARKYAILKIDGDKQGLRLSRLNNSQRNALTTTFITAADKAAAKGLLIYNTESKTLEYWDGTKWNITGTASSLINGINQDATSGNAQLGSDLTKDTEIDQKTNSLTFNTGSGTLDVNSDDFVVTSANVSSNVNTFDVNSGVFNVNNSDITSNVSTNSFTVNTDALTVSNNKTHINGVFSLRDGRQGDGKVLYSDALGNATWADLISATDVVNIGVTWAKGSSSGSNFLIKGTNPATDSQWNTITEEVTLTEGKWLITGKFTTYTSERTDNSTDNKNIPKAAFSWLRIWEDGVVDSKLFYTTAIMPERKASWGNEGSGSYGVPQVTYFLNVGAGGKKIKIQAFSKKGNTWYSEAFGKSYFKAIKINK